MHVTVEKGQPDHRPVGLRDPQELGWHVESSQRHPEDAGYLVRGPRGSVSAAPAQITTGVMTYPDRVT